MDKDRKKTDNRKKNRLPVYNDQLGENASEEYESEDYANAGEDKGSPKGRT